MSVLRSRLGSRQQRGSQAEHGPDRPAPRPDGLLLEVDRLRVDIPTETGAVQAVRGVSLDVARGETVGIVGESGSGKTMLALSLLGLLPGTAKASGAIRLDGQDLLGAGEAQWQRVRGDRVAMVFQDPMTALNPMFTIGWQVAECVRLHRRSDRSAAWQRAVELLAAVGLPEPAQLARRYPHELSGGMRQRVVIAMAIANEPELLVADEPTTALDVTVQAQILDLLKTIRARDGGGHDPDQPRPRGRGRSRGPGAGHVRRAGRGGRLGGGRLRCARDAVHGRAARLAALA